MIEILKIYLNNKLFIFKFKNLVTHRFHERLYMFFYFALY